MLAYEDRDAPWDEDGWTETGDLVRVTEDRVLFAGREGDIINVGGAKVNPYKVEQLFRTIPQILDVRVFARKSSMVGQLVSMEVVIDNEDPDGVKQEIQRLGKEKLQPYEMPRFLKFVDRIGISDALKVQRQDESSNHE